MCVNLKLFLSVPRGENTVASNDPNSLNSPGAFPRRMHACIVAMTRFGAIRWGAVSGADCSGAHADGGFSAASGLAQRMLPHKEVS